MVNFVIISLFSHRGIAVEKFVLILGQHCEHEHYAAYLPVDQWLWIQT